MTPQDENSHASELGLAATLFVIAAPSGAGKTSLVRALVNAMPELQVSISCTTRAPRPMEEDGKDYFFVSDDDFQQMVENDEFLEHARVYERSYGTPRKWVLEQLHKGRDVVLEIDWQGARAIRQSFPAAVLVFILPPSLSTLRQRLALREQDSGDVIEQRMQSAHDEISHFREFDYLIINDQFPQALADLQSILRTRRLLLSHQIHRQHTLLEDLFETG